MLNLRSFYRSTSNHSISPQESVTNRAQTITAGICDYIPQSYFSKQYFSIYLQGLQPQQVIHSILWNQYYQKTLLKQIYSQLTIVSNNKQNTLISKLDSMMSSNNNQMIYLKVESRVYNLKDKLEYDVALELEKEIRQAQSITVEKITQQGRWKKIVVDFGPYKKKQDYDILFQYDVLQNEKKRSTSACDKYYGDSIKYDNQNDCNNAPIVTKNTTQTKTPSIKQSTKKHSAKKQSTNHNYSQSERKPKNIHRITNNNQKTQQQKYPHYIYQSATKSKVKSTIIEQRSSVPSSCKKSQNISVSNNNSNKSIKKLNNNNDEQNITTSHKKIVSCMQPISFDKRILQEINFNSTAKLSSASNNFSNLIQEEPLPIVSLDLKRKQLLKVKQNSILEEDRIFGVTDTETLKNFTQQQSKNNSVLSQILSKKQQTIQTQKRRIQQIEQRHVKEVEELKMKHLKQTESFKNEISQLLNQYSKKYQTEKQETKKLRHQLLTINQILTENKVVIAELHMKTKFNYDQSVRYKQQAQQLKVKLKEMEEKYNNLVMTSREEHSKILGEKNKAKQIAEKYLQKYNALAKKLRIMVQEQQNSLN